jgi:hypothetical protein
LNNSTSKKLYKKSLIEKAEGIRTTVFEGMVGTPTSRY